MNNLNNKKILLIICGGISAYKSLEIIRLLKKSEMITFRNQSIIGFLVLVIFGLLVF